MDDFNQDAELREQLQELANRFLQRSHSEAQLLQKLIVRVEAADLAALTQLNDLSHKISGSAATFGFMAVSQRAGELEQLIRGITAHEALTVGFKDLESLRACHGALVLEIDKARGAK